MRTRGRTSRGSYEREALKSAEGEVTNLMPDEERTVAFVAEGRKLGKVIQSHARETTRKDRSS